MARTLVAEAFDVQPTSILGAMVSYVLEPGTDVEVQSSFDHDWKRGFVIEGACPQGYHLRRRSDDSILPATFPAEVVRPVSSPQLFR